MKFKRFTSKNILFNSLVVLLYLLWMSIVGDLKSDHFLLVAIWLTAFYASEKTRRFVLGFSVFIIFWILYDSMRIVPNYKVSTPHIAEPYNLEKLLFGIKHLGKILTPNEYFLVVNNSVLDFLSGFFYLNWMPVPIGFGIYLYLTNKKLFLEYSLAFLLVNIIGFVIYYLYPAAPPWYIQKYGFELRVGVPGNRAGLWRFDELVGVPVFKSIYNKNANVLAAMPSLHAAYPVIVFYYAYKKGVKRLAMFFFLIFLFGIWFSAVYSSHHYVIDVLAGIFVAIFTLIVFKKIILKKSFIKSKIRAFSERI